jgi:LysR family transcriptional regulator, hypochlorite-specific transcription factor HypT
MDIKWLEDILVLYEERNFSRAAKRRHITQPAFSRRVQLFEQWVGEEIIDRSTQPISFTPIMERQLSKVSNAVIDIYDIRNAIRADSATKSMTFATQHTLTTTVFPDLLSVIKTQIKSVTVRLRTANLPECIVWLEQGDVAFLLCYESPIFSSDYSENIDKLKIGNERLIPVTAVNADGNRIHDPNSQTTLKMMNYPAGSFLRNVVNRGQAYNGFQDYIIENVCESSLATALKQLVVAGMGIAWLPSSLVQSEIESGELDSLEENFGATHLSIVLLTNPSRATDTSNRVWNRIKQSYSNDEGGEKSNL